MSTELKSRNIFADGREYDRFYYTVVEVAKLTARAILQTGLQGLFPLILLADGGTAPDVVQKMAESLTAAREAEVEE